VSGPQQQASFYDPTWMIDVPDGLTLRPHPCPFPDYVLDIYQHIVDEHMGANPRIMDGMGGLGYIHYLLRCQTFSNELEPEWAYSHPKTMVGDARYLPFDNNYFQGYFFSPPYANRLADKYQPKPEDRSGRKSYRISLEREVSLESSSELQWGEDYRELSVGVIEEACRVLAPKGLLAINVKGHYRNGRLIDVSDWYDEIITGLGLNFYWGIDLLDEKGWTFAPEASRNRDSEKVLVYRK